MHEKPAVQIRGKKFWMITGIAGVIIVAVLAILIFQVPGNNMYTLNPVTTSSPAHLQASVTSYPQGGSTTRQPDRFTPATTPSVPVDFILQSGEPASCGLTCRQLDAMITNTGYDTAHNVCITVTLHNSRNEVINLNGDSLSPALYRRSHRRAGKNRINIGGCGLRCICYQMYRGNADPPDPGIIRRKNCPVSGSGNTGITSGVATPDKSRTHEINTLLKP